MIDGGHKRAVYGVLWEHDHGRRLEVFLGAGSGIGGTGGRAPQKRGLRAHHALADLAGCLGRAHRRAPDRGDPQAVRTAELSRSAVAEASAKGMIPSLARDRKGESDGT